MEAKMIDKMGRKGLLKLSRSCGHFWNELILFRSCDDMIGRYK
jgi:hypothetical protein